MTSWPNGSGTPLLVLSLPTTSANEFFSCSTHKAKQFRTDILSSHRTGDSNNKIKHVAKLPIPPEWTTDVFPRHFSCYVYVNGTVPRGPDGITSSAQTARFITAAANSKPLSIVVALLLGWALNSSYPPPPRSDVQGRGGRGTWQPSPSGAFK